MTVDPAQIRALVHTATTAAPRDLRIRSSTPTPPPHQARVPTTPPPAAPYHEEHFALGPRLEPRRDLTAESQGGPRTQLYAAASINACSRPTSPPREKAGPKRQATGTIGFLGPLGSLSSHHRQTRELDLQDGPALFQASSLPLPRPIH